METLKKSFKKKQFLFNVILYGFLFAVFVGLFLMGNYGGGGDSDSYLTMGITREPLYPLFLWGLRQVFGADGYYVQLAFLQNLFSFVATACMVEYLGNRVFKNKIMKLISAVILIMPYLMTPLFSRTHLVMANKVMAEGITIPGYYFFVLFLLKIIYEDGKLIRNIICASTVSALLILARGQMMLTIVILFVVVFIKLLVQKKYKQLYLPVLTAILLFMVTGFLTNLYHYYNSGIFTGTASGKPMILANVLYVSEADDGKNITNPDLSQLFERTYQALDEKQMLYQYASGGIIDKALYHEKCHDDISFDYFEPIKNDIYVDRMGSNYAEYMVVQDKIAAALTKELIVNNWSRVFPNYINICALGFVRSIAVEHPLLNYYALVAYLIGAGLLVFTWWKKGFTREVFFFGMTYVMIAGFVMATSFFLQCITRYMIYNLPFFYIAGAALLWGWFPPGKKETKTEV